MPVIGYILHNTYGTSNKFYEIYVQQLQRRNTNQQAPNTTTYYFEVIAVWGPIGYAGRRTSKGTYTEFRNAWDRVTAINQRQRDKGYNLVRRISNTDPRYNPITDPSLVATIPVSDIVQAVTIPDPTVKKKKLTKKKKKVEGESKKKLSRFAKIDFGQ